MSFILSLNESGDSLYIQRRDYLPKNDKTVFIRNAKSDDGVFSFDYIGEVITNFEIPNTSVYKIEAWGASGGTLNAAPKGAYSKSFVTLNKGERIRILVGERGYDGNSVVTGNANCAYCSGGGGGSFVVKGETPLCVAGGGGGNGYSSHDSVASYACGQSGQRGGDPQSRRVSITHGGLASSSHAGGGGGFIYNGGNSPNTGKGGISFVNGGSRQTASGYSGYSYGGFGGGGSTHGCCGGSGGGGGYTGGGGSIEQGPQGGGGGSYFIGTYGEENSTAISGCDSFPTKPLSGFNGYVRLTIMSTIPSIKKRIINSCVCHRFEIQWLFFATLLSS
jgi:hypothetical protein